MKKAILGFADRLLSKEQMKKVRGGCGSGGSGYPNCGTETAYRCSISVGGGPAVSGWGCGSSAQATADGAIRQGASTAYCGQ